MISTKYPVYVKYVEKKKSAKGNIYTTFQVGDKIKDSDGQYVNYRVTVFDDLNINDGDKVQLTSINNIESREYKGKVYNSFVASVDAPNQVQKDSSALPFDI